MLLSAACTKNESCDGADCITGPGPEDPGAGAPAFLDVQPDSVALSSLGDSVRLLVSVRDEGGNPLATPVETWTSSNPAVATVDSLGTVRALAPGETFVLAELDELQALVSVLVDPLTTTIDVARDSVVLAGPGAVDTLTATPLDAGGSTVSGAVLLWESADTSVVVVDADGVLTAVGEGEAVVSVTSAGASTAVVVRVVPELVLVTAVLRTGVRTEPYADTLAATGGVEPYAWSLIAGALPAGMGLGAAGALEGTPGTAGVFDLTVRVESADGQADTASFDLEVFGQLQITTLSLSSGVSGAFYSRTVNRIGGDGTNSWSVVSGNLPTGLSIGASTGIISGTPTQTGTFTFTLEVESGDGQTATRGLQIIVYAPLTITTTSLPTASCFPNYPVQLQATGGAGGNVWSLISGSLPPSYSLSSGGVISGPEINGSASYPFTVRVQSSDGQSDTQALAINLVIC